MKPDTTTAMHQLIAEVRAVMPFDRPEAQLCSADCTGCSQKLLGFLNGELEDWERRLDAGERPNFGDLDRLAKTSRRIYRVLERNGLVGGA